MFTAAFPLDQDEFEIPNINWMAYLHKDFEVIEYSDAAGNPLDISAVGMPCWFKEEDIKKIENERTAVKAAKIVKVVETVIEDSEKENT